MLILIHHSEIILKGKNRSFFENKLADQFNLKLKPKHLKKISGGYIIDTNVSKPEEKLKTIFGFNSFAVIEPIEKIEEVVNKIKNLEFKTFAVRTKRSDKQYPQTSRQINIELGDLIRTKLNKQVDLTNPDLTVYLEIIQGKIYLYTKKHLALGGLPLGSSDKLVSLISSGIDSPVSSYLMLKRGAELIYTHFHSYPHTSKQSVLNVQKIITQLNKFQNKAKLYSIGIGQIQKQIVTLAPAPYRVLLYRRLMLKLAAQIALKEKALGLITGESLGQVASQTLSNMQTTSAAVQLPIYRPLISFDKQEIVSLAKQINTYEISIQPYDDCCSFLIPASVATYSQPEKLATIEKEINLDQLLKQAEIDIIKL